ERGDDRAERAAHHHGDGQIQNVPAQDELLEPLEHGALPSATCGVRHSTRAARPFRRGDGDGSAVLYEPPASHNTRIVCAFICSKPRCCMGGVSVIAVVLLLSFGIDRLVTGILFVLSWSKRWRELCPDPAEAADAQERVAAERKQKTAYFVFAGLF